MRARAWLEFWPEDRSEPNHWGDWAAIGLVALIFTLAAIALLAGLGAVWRFG